MLSNPPDERLSAAIVADVERALSEDVGSGDLTGQLLPAAVTARAKIESRESLILAGSAWVDEVYSQLDPGVEIEWQARDGDRVESGTVICRLEGPVRSLLTGERVALNFLQTLSATATVTAEYVDAVAGSGAKILDTRKTIPGLRVAQKYAVRCGGGYNHRAGLYDAILIKENHIGAAGGVVAAIEGARETHPGLPVEIEVETFDEFRDALAARAERLLLDNFAPADIARLVEINRRTGEPPAELEASGGLTIESLKEVAATGVDYLSVGALTKNVKAVDLSMRIEA